MKVKMQSVVKSITRLDSETTLELEFTGKEVVAADTSTRTAKTASMKSTLVLKTVMADDLKVGSVFTITLDDEEPLNRLD